MLTKKQHEQALLNEYNFDHPDAFDIDLLVEVLTKLKEGRMVEVPIYNFVTHSRESKTVSSNLLHLVCNFLVHILYLTETYVWR